MKKALFLSLYLTYFLLTTYYLYLTFDLSVSAQTSNYLKVGIGDYVWGSTYPSNTEVYNRSLSLAATAKAQLGADQTKLVLAIINTGNKDQMLAAIKTVFPPPTVIAGAGTGTANDVFNYPPMTRTAFPAPGTYSMAIIAMGGTAITSVASADDTALYGWGNNPTAITEGGRTIARQLPLNQQTTNLLIMLGPGHTPNNDYLVQGFKDVYGNPLPANLKIIGMGSADGTAVSIVNGDIRPFAASAVIIRGTFQLALRGVGPGFGGDPATVSQTLMEELKTELNGNPDLLIYIPGHPQLDPNYDNLPLQESFDRMHISFVNTFGTTQPLFGHHATSETGHKVTNGPVVASAGHFFVAGLKADSIASPTITSTPTSTLTPMPTLTPTSAPTAVPGDANGDSHVDGVDYVVWLNHYNTSTTNGASDGDFSNDGNVDGLDYVVWLNNYGV